MFCINFLLYDVQACNECAKGSKHAILSPHPATIAQRVGKSLLQQGEMQPSIKGQPENHPP